MGFRTLRVAIGLLIVFVIAASPIGWATARSNQPQAPTELLVNPGFEEPFTAQGGDVFIAQGWQAWYVVPDPATAYPPTCPEPIVPTCKPYHIPGYRTSQPQNDRIPPRARSGASQQWGTAWAVYIAGVYQSVGGLTPGTRLRFSAYTQGFNCDDDRGCFGGVGEYGKSYEPGDMQTRVGIDPTGGANVFSPNIVWSGFANPLDAFVLQAVEAVAQGTAVTVFIWSSPTYPELHTDIYIDDASLIAVGQGPAPTAAPTQAGTPGPTNTPGTPPPTTTIPPNTGTYAIQSGDTLSAIAERYKLTLDQLLALNPSLTGASILQVGQVINIGGTPQLTTPTPVPATVAPTATTAATAATTPTLSTSTPVANATPALAASGVCFSAYDDLNGNGLRETGEGLITGVQFTVTDANGQISATYASDGVSEPQCIATLPDGRYIIDIVPPANRTATTDLKWSV
ncbi:MAG TPA: LysM domain-containing protein, partial [Anaerolineae bacterium]|nr:LysM domain-containing protein [Anaerolineae bacterium]